MGGKSWFRCTVCNDMHYGLHAPETCPTCKFENAYIIVTEQEADICLFEHQTRRGKNAWPLEELLKHFRDWTENQEFMLNPDDEHLIFTLEGVLRCELQRGLKYCPCRIPAGDFEKDLSLLCPCNFRVQPVYEEQARCWCGLFVHRDRWQKS